jgi:hypothetical protein
MAWRNRAIGAALALVLVGGANAVQAQSPLRVGVADAATVQLNGVSGGAQVMTLQLRPENDAETVPAWGRGWHGGFHGWHGGFRGWHGGVHGWHGGVRGWHGGFRGWYGFRPFFWGGFYRPWFGSSFYVTPSFFAPRVYYFCPIGLTLGTSMDQAPDAAVRRVEPQDPYGQRPAPDAANGSYPYNGGPVNPVPMPKAKPDADKVTPPAPTVPMDGRAVSLPVKPKYTYPAYGEEPKQTDFARDRTAVVKNR